jgi:PKD repeat protein
MGIPVPFDAKSNDPDGNVVSYDWDFGDGTSGSGIRSVHAYDRVGTFEVILKVTDSYNATCTSSTTATIQPEASTDFTINCQENILFVFAGGDSRQATCSVISLNGFTGTVDLGCEIPTNPSVACSFSPRQVTPQANGTVSSTMIVGAGFDSPFGTYDLIIKGISGGKTFTTILRLDVLPV